jgi:hypothetical protein
MDFMVGWATRLTKARDREEHGEGHLEPSLSHHHYREAAGALAPIDRDQRPREQDEWAKRQ